MLLSGSSASLSLGFRFFLEDKFSTQIGHLKDALHGYSKEFSAFQENIRAARNMSAGIAAGAGLMLNEFISGVRGGAQFSYMLEQVGIASESTAGELQNLVATAKGLGQTTMFGPTEVGSAMHLMALAGLSAKTINTAMVSAVNMAGATSEALGGHMGSADILTHYIRAFGLADEQIAQTADILTVAAIKSNVSMGDLGNSIRYVAATSRNVGVPMSETIGMLMTLGNAGIQASMAGTALENMYRYLAMAMGSNATKRQLWAMEQLRLKARDLTDPKTGGFLPFADVLTKIKTGLAGMGGIEAQNVVKELFGVRGQRAGMTLIRALEDVRTNINTLNDPSISGTAARNMKRMMNTLEGSFLNFSNAIKATWASIAKAVEPVLRPILQALTGIIKAVGWLVDHTWAGKGLAIAIGATLAWTTALYGLRAAFLGVAYAMRTLTVSNATMAASTKAMFMMMMGKSPSNRVDKKALWQAKRNVSPEAIRNQMFLSNPRLGYSDYRKDTTGMGYYDKKSGKRVSNMAAARMAVSARSTLATVVTKNTGMLGMVGKGLSGILGFFGGPWGLVMMGLLTLGPLLISKIGDWIGAIKEEKDKTVAGPYRVGTSVADILAGRLSTNETIARLTAVIIAEMSSGNKTLDELLAEVKKGGGTMLFTNGRMGFVTDPIRSSAGRDSNNLIR
jgi:TP901 family phage tail tape measure protein